MMYRDFLEAGYPVFGLHGINKNKMCTCGNPKCTALFKHPLVSNWQHTPLFSDEQIEAGELAGQFDTGYGILVNGLIVIDVDERNGGVESYAQLVEDIPEVTQSELIVRSGSGGNSKHIFFKAPKNVSLQSHITKYRGIDFKSSGFVVGAGSRHISGNTYDVLYGSPDQISDAPKKLIELLEKKETNRSTFNGDIVDLTDNEIISMLNHISPDCDYEMWIRCGMATHHATNGAGFDIWDTWSAKSEKYPLRDTLLNRWHSFGKSANPVSVGTLIHYAEQNGYAKEITFDSKIQWNDEENTPQSNEINISNIDLLRPPSFVGRIAEWINAKSRFPREHLAVAAALMAVSCAGGMRFRCEIDNTVGNLFTFGVAGSATGKESIINSLKELLRRAGISAAAHGTFKSDREIYQNLIRHQAAFYTIDEMGEILSRIVNARKKGNAAYLEGIVGTLMNIYSKSDDYALLSGDMKEEIRKALQLEKSILEKEEPTQRTLNRIERVEHSLNNLDSGLENPYLNIFGVTTPERFNELMDFDMASSGFVGRSIIFKELNDNPRPNKKTTLNTNEEAEKIAMFLSQLYLGGKSEADGFRVERQSDIETISTTKDGLALLERIEEVFFDMAELHKETTGLTALPRRGKELVNKVSLVLAIPEGLRTYQHILWAYALVKRDIDNKINITHANSAINKDESLIARILSHIDDEGVSVGVLCSKCRPIKQDVLIKCLDFMQDKKMIFSKEIKPVRGKSTKKYFKS